eukprot:Plantae.Rhodophyta-Hildenbrandia_rubra.ctg15130.p1 GENE.Plantae.Rhodophyta-Hildenbrandia_rubra.ctg15130~~Plantae.Rhodophyta-Hildenbrandia_rubra.ctg15130.p1  ORF type:complete len:489 (+),score=80.91 Plantae.Rhodophyta-Hildenbrandia_rubra.ctg15130:123-1589(+)
MEFNTIIEPFRIKTVQPIKHSDLASREAALAKAHYNLFQLQAEDVIIDLLTDSGTGALSTVQQSGMVQSDESYAGAKSFEKFEHTIREITGFDYIIPTHQGRAAERILFETMVSKGHLVPSNTHFDTTRANVEAQGAVALDIPIAEAYQPQLEHPFKGNMDTGRLEKLLQDDGDKVPLVMFTVTNNSVGGQPASLENIRQVSKICRKYGVPLFLDAARFAENSWFIKTREVGCSEKSPTEIAKEMFALSDGCLMSAKKDGMVNMGGFLALADVDVASSSKELLIRTEGFPTYGGLAGYDLESVAIGLREALDEQYLQYRIRSIEYLCEKLIEGGIPIVRPAGGHAVYIDAKAMLSHIPQSQYPAWTLSLALYLLAGIRSVEIGSVMFGLQPDGTEKPAEMELVRMAFPRRVYTQSHVDYVAEAILWMNTHKELVSGVRIVSSSKTLRHFTAKLEPIGSRILSFAPGAPGKKAKACSSMSGANGAMVQG